VYGISYRFLHKLTIVATIVMNPGGPKSGTGTPHSVSTVVATETDELLRIAREEGKFGKRKQTSLKDLACSGAFQVC
jgi:hypothetical protein